MATKAQQAVEEAQRQDAAAIPMTAELVVAEPDHHLATVFDVEQGSAVIERASAMAKPLAEVIEAQGLFVPMGKGKRHVTVEGWTLLGSMVGVHPHTTYVERVFDSEGKDVGWKATVEARKLNGDVVATAESMCLRDEDRWSNRDNFQLASMAQTRATSKAMRQSLSFVMVLAGFQATPAEEITSEDPLAPQILEALEEGFSQDDILVEARKYTKERGGKNQIRNLKVLSKAPGEYLDVVLDRLRKSQAFDGAETDETPEKENPVAEGPPEDRAASVPEEEASTDDTDEA